MISYNISMKQGNIICIVLGLLVIVFLTIWSNSHDNKVMENAEKYEECIRKEYNGMSPAYYYNVNGEYPECYEVDKK